MAERLYLVPAVWDGGKMKMWCPKYIWPFRQRRNVNFGHQGYFISAANISEAAHQSIVEDPECFVVPENLDAQVGANVAQVQNALETMGFPCHWVNSAHTYRQVLRLCYAACRVFQRVAGILHSTLPFIAGQVTLDTQFGDLPQVGRNALLQVAQEWNLDYSGLTLNSTLREIIKAFADQMPTRKLGGIEI